MVTLHVLPSNAFIPLPTLDSTGDNRSFASNSIWYFSFAHFESVRCVLSADSSNLDTLLPALSVDLPALSAASPIFPNFLTRLESSGSVRSMVSIGISIRNVSASFLIPFRLLQINFHRFQHKYLYSSRFLIKFIWCNPCPLKDMMKQAGFPACLN